MNPMFFEPRTLVAVNLANLLALALALFAIMGRDLSQAARSARNALLVQASGWLFLLLACLWPWTWKDHLFSTLAMACYSVCNWLSFQALKGWLGPRRHERLLLVLVVLMPVGYSLGFYSYVWRVGWANALTAFQLLLLARAAIGPISKMKGRWRFVLVLCLVTMAGLTLGRGIMGAFFTELYPRFMAPHPLNLAALFMTNVTMVVANVSLLVGWREEAELLLREQLITDPLTTVLNRNGWNELAPKLFAHARRHGQPLALLMLDLDFFKQINDRLGHEAGDAALRFFGELLRREQRAGDLVARIGGEEFCVLLPLADVEAARGFDLRLRRLVAVSAFEALSHGLDFSSGLACREGDESLDALMNRADRALYRAKDGGRGSLAESASGGAPHEAFSGGLV